MEVQSAGSTHAPEFLDRHPWLPVLLLILLPFAVSVPLWLFGFSTDPIWYVSGTTTASQPFPGYPFIDPNAGFTSEALGRLSAWDWVHGIIPWWNPYTGVGMPLAGEMQPGSFFLPFNLLFLLKEGVLWQKMCMQIIAGLMTYALLRELRLSRLASLMSGAVFAFNATIAWTPGPAAGYCSLPFLPLLLWGIERARKKASSAASILAIGCAIAWSILAGFPEPAYISGLLALAWGVYRLAGEQDRWGMARRAAIGFVLGLLVAAPLLIAFADYLQRSDSFSVHLLGEAALPIESFAQTMMPYVYGPMPSIFHSQPMTGIWGSTGGYAGSMLVLMALVGLCRRSTHGRLRILVACWVGIAWAKSLGVQPIRGIMNFIPLLRRAAFFRYADPSWIFALVVLAAFGLDELSSLPPRRRYPFGIALAMLGLAVGAAWPTHAFWQRPTSLRPLMFLLIGLSLAWVVVEFVLTSLLWTRLQLGTRRILLAALLVFDAVAMFAMPQFSARRNTHLDTPAIQFLHDHQGLSRLYSMGPLQANYGAYFQLAEIDHNSLPVPALWTHYADSSLLPGILDKSAGVGFEPQDFEQGYGGEALSSNLQNYLDIGVRYVITGARQAPIARLFTPALTENNSSELPSTTSLLDRVTFLRPVFAECRRVAGDPSAFHVLRTVAQAVLKRLAPYAPINTGITGPRPVNDSGRRLLTLPPGQSVTVTLTAAAMPASGKPVLAVAMMPGNDSSDGDLSVEVCAGSDCAHGHRALSEAVASNWFSVPLEKPLTASASLPMKLVLARTGAGSGPAVSLFMQPASGDEVQQIETAAGLINGEAVQLGFDYSRPLPGLQHVYSDALMEIWQLPDTAPYFEVIHGGPCTLVEMQRESLAADCQSPATLMRRELFMPGWKASINGKTVEPEQQDTIFQAIHLPTGHSQAVYRFVPPHMTVGWVLCAAGLTGLLWQLVVLLRERHSAPA